MTKSETRSAEVGSFIRQQVIPPGMTVTEAARRLGVGRPALSNLLNGRAALSQEMALRLEGTFGADRGRLLDLQAASDRNRRRVEDRAVAVGTYAPDFLTIKARQIADWAEDIRARKHLPVLLRRLVHATGRELRHVDFPGYDNSQRHGWDGWVEADAATPWVPEGKSGWEFGVGQHPKRKAEHDYRARVNATPPAERAECAFVFVTPRNWEGKHHWAGEKEATGDWSAVRAFDASDIEQWLETTIAPRIWLARELGIPTDGFMLLDAFWDHWAAASNPPLTASIFAPSVAASVEKFRKWLETSQPDRPFTVSADSLDEAVAFLACLLRHDDVPVRDRDRAVVFKSASTLRTLAQSSSPFMPIVYSEEIEREIAALYRQRHCVVVQPRNAVDEPDVAVELLGHAAFAQALSDMGIEQDVNRLASESGRSPTVLRRRLSPFRAIRTPPWADDQEIARRLLPMGLVGAWDEGSKADREILEKLAGCDYEGVTRNFADLLRRDDCPVWSIHQHRGVVSKIDTLFAVCSWVVRKDLENFMAVADCVLSEADPALEFPEDQQWAAPLHGKVRKYSNTLRTGICETLTMISVHGSALFGKRLGIDVSAAVATLIESLLTPFTSEKLRSHDADLPSYAEAAPEEFLSLLEKDLKQQQPVLLELLKSVGPGMFNHPARTGILWALERLAWNPATFMRVVTVLARLSAKKIDDNWANKPIGSLSALFRSWLPQTAAPLDDRIRAFEALCRRFPDIGWRICIKQFEGGPQAAFPSARPRWRNDAAGAGYEVNKTEWSQFVRKALDLAISWPSHDRTTLGDLIARLDAIEDQKDRSAIWNCIDAWSRTETDEKQKAALREHIRRTVSTRSGRLRGLADQRDRARKTCDNLVSRDSIQRHAWLFVSDVEYLTDERDDDEEDFDIRREERRLYELRTTAMNEIWSARGFDGALALLSDGDGCTIGRSVARHAADVPRAIEVVQNCLSTDVEPPEKLDSFLRGFLSKIDADVRSTVVSELANDATVDQVVRVLGCAPFREQTWRLLDDGDGHVRDGYWRTVRPVWERFTESETTELIDRLLEAGRPRDAFRAVNHQWEKVETSRLKRLLRAIVRVHPQIEIEPWRLSMALDSLDGRSGVTADEMAQLEFACSDSLLSLRPTAYGGHGIPNLERRIAESPVLFVWILTLVYKRDDDGQDPPEWHVDDSAQRATLFSTAYRLLSEVTRIPGADNEGRVDAHALRVWVTDARHRCSENGRGKIGDEKIGTFLSNAPPEKDGAWPCRSVCKVLEEIASPDIAAGFDTGVFNARGVHSRSLDAGGEPERELSTKYRKHADRWAFDYPYVSGILKRIAENYNKDAERWDSDMLTRRRLEH